MAHQWRGVIREYYDRLDVDASTPIITLGEGGTPLVEAPALAKLVGAAEVYLKVEGMNPTGSFKDRGMTMAKVWTNWVSLLYLPVLGSSLSGLSCASKRTVPIDK